MAKFDVVTIGGAVKDITFYTNQGRIFSTPENFTAQKMIAFEYGAKIDTKEVYLNWGGGAANSAVSLSRLGLKIETIIRVGKDDTGKSLIKNLNKEKINTNSIQLDTKTPTGFSLILGIDRKEREHIGFLFRGANNNLSLVSKNLNKVNSDWIYLTSLSGKNWLSNLKIIFNSVSQKKIKIAWNPGNLQLQGGKRFLGNFLKQTNILILNKDEAIELVLSGMKLGRKSPKHLNRPLYLLNILQEWGPKIVLITDGKKGAWAYDGKRIYYQKALSNKVVDTTGVGDAFGSSFLAGWVIGKGNVQKALKLGAINSGSVISKVGAQNGLLIRKELEKRL